MDARAESEFRDFVAARSAALMRTAYVLTRDQHRAEDLLQDVLAGLARRWDRVEDPEAYTRRALYHRQASWWRGPGRTREVLHAVLPERPASEQAPMGDDRVVIVHALRRLTPRQRAVLALRYLEDLPEAETAALLGCSVGTVRSQTHRALVRIRRLAPELRDLSDHEEVPR